MTNQLKLNKYHQLVPKVQSHGKRIRKQKRDIERLLRYKAQHCQATEQKEAQLEQLNKELAERSKAHQRKQRKAYFLKKKYGPVMQVELKKVKRALGKIKDRQAAGESGEQLLAQKQSLHQKLLYIKHYPGDRKYISLFPRQGLNDKARQFQAETMAQILAERNRIASKWQAKLKHRREATDEFFVEEKEEQEGQEGQEEEQDD